MTVSNTTVKVSYNGNGSTRTFSIPFPIISAAHLCVIVTNPNGVETTIHSGYTINDELNTLTYPTLETEQDPLASGYKITLIRQTPLTQDLDLHVHTALEAERLEAAYDKLTYHVQELAEEVGRAIKSNVSETQTPTAQDYLDTITAAVENATTAATSAASSATSASNSATVATEKATAAYNSADAAASSATTAEGYKDAAASSASSAATSATDAASAQAAAETAQGDAEAARDLAQGYKDDAAGYASAAGQSSTAAAGYASDAETAKDDAVTAKTQAESAKAAAVSAKTDAETAATSAQTAAAALTAHNTDTSAHADIRTTLAGKQDALPDGSAGLFLKKTENGVEWAQPSGGGGGGSAEWGGIGGTLANQTDLKNALDAKQPKTLDTAITVAGESKTTVEAALSAINTLATGKAAASHTHTTSDITNFPSIPTKLSDLTDDLGTSPTHTHSQYLESVAWDDVSNKPSSFTPASHTHTTSDITNFPTIPSKVSDLQNDSGFITDIAVATTSTAGKVKPDGTTITAAADGTISAVGGSSELTATYDSTNKVLTLL